MESNHRNVISRNTCHQIRFNDTSNLLILRNNFLFIQLGKFGFLCESPSHKILSCNLVYRKATKTIAHVAFLDCELFSLIDNDMNNCIRSNLLLTISKNVVAKQSNCEFGNKNNGIYYES